MKVSKFRQYFDALVNKSLSDGNELVFLNADVYKRQGLENQQDKLIPPKPTANSNPSWFGFLMTVKEGVDCVKVVKYIEEHGIQTLSLIHI